MSILAMPLYAITILTTFGLVPAVLISLSVRYCQGKLDLHSTLAILCFPAAYLAAAMLGWTFRPFPWSLSFADTWRANFADHSIEYYAERVLLYVLAVGSIGTWLAVIAALAWSRLRARHSARV